MLKQFREAIKQTCRARKVLFVIAFKYKINSYTKPIKHTQQSNKQLFINKIKGFPL